jgi:tetratricopeptide (TPR) repeat protein
LARTIKEKKGNLFYFVIIALFSFAIYANSLKNDFVFDDESVVQNNLSIQSLSNIPKYFTAEEGFHKVIGRYYRPVVSTTYAIDFYFWGLNPIGFHLTNIIINMISCLFLFSVLNKLFKNYKSGNLAALLATLIFSSHPVHTEAVSWISGRTDSIATLFFFISFFYYIKKNDDNKINHSIILSLLFYTLGLLSKEMVITLPVLIFLYDYVFLKKNLKILFKNRINIYLLFAVLTFLYLIIRYLVLRNVPERETYMYFYGKDFITGFATMLKTIPVYLKLLILPVNLIYHYNGVISDANSILDINVILSLFLIFSILFTSYILYKRYNEISFALLFILVSFLPVMNIVPSMNLMAERFLYLTSFSVSLLIAYVIVKFERYKNPLIAFFSVIIVTFSILTFLRNQDWKNNDTLYSTGEGINGSVLLVNTGNLYANKKLYDEAASRYRKALEIRQNSVLANHNLGLTFLIKGNTDSAEYYIKRGIAIDSLAPDGYFQLANIYQSQGNFSEAKKNLEKLQIIVPDYRGSKKILDNLVETELNVQQNPSVPDNQISILDKRSYSYYQEGKFELAIQDLLELSKLNPKGKSGYFNNIALCYIAVNKFSEAEKYFTEAIKSDGKNSSLLIGLADLYLKMGNVDKAKSNYRKAIENSPDNIYAKNKLDSLSGK